MLRHGITSFEDRVEEAAEMAGIKYYTHRYYCFNCKYILKMDSRTEYQRVCGNCHSKFGVGDHVEPDGILIYGRKSFGFLYIDGGVHGKYRKMIKDDRARQRIIEDGHLVFVLANAEVGKPRRLTKQKYEEFVPGEVTIAALRNMNLSAILLGYLMMLQRPTTYIKIASAEKEIVGIGKNTGIRRVR